MSAQGLLFSLGSSYLLVAKEVEQDQVIKGVWATFVTTHDVVCFSVFIVE